MPLVDLKRKAEAEAEAAPRQSVEAEYPYGLRLVLDEETLAALGITSLPTVGTEYTIVAKASVVEVMDRTSANGERHRSMDLQIEKMQLDKPTSAQDMFPTMK